MRHANFYLGIVWAPSSDIVVLSVGCECGWLVETYVPSGQRHTDPVQRAFGQARLVSGEFGQKLLRTATELWETHAAERVGEPDRGRVSRDVLDARPVR